MYFEYFGKSYSKITLKDRLRGCKIDIVQFIICMMYLSIIEKKIIEIFFLLYLCLHVGQKN